MAALSGLEGISGLLRPLVAPFHNPRLATCNTPFQESRVIKKGSLDFVLVYILNVQECMVNSLKDECKSETLTSAVNSLSTSSADRRSFLKFWTEARVAFR